MSAGGGGRERRGEREEGEGEYLCILVFVFVRGSVVWKCKRVHMSVRMLSCLSTYVPSTQMVYKQRWRNLHNCHEEKVEEEVTSQILDPKRYPIIRQGAAEPE